MSASLLESRHGRLRIWEQPGSGYRYVCGIDIAAGKVKDKVKRARQDIVSYSDDRPDYSAIIVLEMETANHVATWHGHQDTYNFSWTCQEIGVLYNHALLVPEATGLGIGVIERLVRDFNYPNVYQSKRWNQVDFDDPFDNRYGFSTTAQSRPLLIDQVTQAVETGTLRTYDERLVRELQTMEVDDNGVARGRGKNKDDLVMALGLALQGRHELLTGSTIRSSESPYQDLSHHDQEVWRKIKERQEDKNGSNRVRLGGSVRRGGGL